MSPHGIARSAKVLAAAPSTRLQEIRGQIQLLSERDLSLWSLILTLVLVLTVGLAAIVAPDLAWRIRSEHYPPGLFLALILLILGFSIRAAAQKRKLTIARKALLEKLLFIEQLEGFSLVDPLTELLNRRALEQLLAKEIVRSNRLGTPLTLMLLHLTGFRTLAARAGVETGDQFLREVALLLTGAFRGSDTVFRFGGDEFVVMMPDTTEQQGECAVNRLMEDVQRWNIESRTTCEISLSWSLTPYVTGTKIIDVLESARRKVFFKANQLQPVSQGPSLRRDPIRS